MHRRPLPLALALALVLALLLPVVAIAQIGSASRHLYSLSAPLSGGAEVPPADPDGFGFARITILLDSGQLCFQTSVARIEPATASHIHAGAGGAAGPVVVPLGAPGPDGLVSGCVAVDAGLLSDILSNPWNYYVNVHNDAYPAGAIRGQLEMAGAQPPPPPALPSWELETVIDALSNPHGVDMTADGALHVAEAGSGGDECYDVGTPDEPAAICLGMTGAVTMVADGVVEQVGDSLPSLSDGTGTFSGGPQATATDADGNFYVVTGLGATAADRDGLGSEIASMLGKVYMLAPDGSWSEVADLATYEFENNTTGDFYVNEETGAIDPSAPNLESNPFAVVAAGDGVLVADAGANAVLHVTAGGTISPYAIFPPEMIEAPEFLGLPPGTIIPMDVVPTAVANGSDGAVYVGQLTGFPFPVGGAKIWRLEDLNSDGDAMDEGEMTVYAEGLTAVVDIEFGPDGTLYAVEIAKNGLLAAEEAEPDDVEAVTGAIIAVASDGSLAEVVSTGLVLPGGVAVADDGSLYITNGSVFPADSAMPGSLVHATQSE